MHTSVLLLSALTALASAAALPQDFRRPPGFPGPPPRPGFPGGPPGGFPGFPGRPGGGPGGPPGSVPATPIGPGIPTTPSPTSSPSASPTPDIPDSGTPDEGEGEGGTACNVGSLAQPVAPTPLPVPASDLTLSTVLIGRGTQNYTCGADLTVAPTQVGAVADLFEGNCIATNNGQGTPGAAAGTHFFFDNTTPEFDVTALGTTRLKKAAASTAPANTNGDVPWLKLDVVTDGAGTSSKVKSIYRLRTKGGAAPTTCEGKTPGEVFGVEYEAEYWFYTSA